MSFYQQMTKVGTKVMSRHKLFKIGFNLSPMYRRSTGRIISVSEDLLKIRIKLPLSWKNKNYVGSIFGGSIFSAIDPIAMVQLINILGDEYVVWDKAAEVQFKRPAREHIYTESNFSPEEIADIKERVANEQELDYDKLCTFTNEPGDTVFAEIHKKLYIADKKFYKEKRAKKKG